MTARSTKTILAAAASLVAGLVLVSGATFAGQRQDTIDANREVMNQRIEQGRYNGTLTRREYRELKAEQAKIERDIKSAQADGRISRSEYNKIHDEQIQAYRHIKTDVTNDRISFWRRWLFLTRD